MKETLIVIMKLSHENYTAEKLCNEMEISLATLKRDIAEARHLGAKIESFKEGKKSYYRLENWEECKKRTCEWLDYEARKTVIER